MTKSILHCFVACLCFLALANCGLLKDASSDFTIRVSGTEGLKFSGHYSIVGNKTLPEPIRAYGVGHGEYKGTGSLVLCSFRKLVNGGSLKVEILKDGMVISESTTSIPYGFVSLKTQIPEKNTMIAQIMGKIFGSDYNKH
jgi:hypothetical protein